MRNKLSIKIEQLFADVMCTLKDREQDHIIWLSLDISTVSASLGLRHRSDIVRLFDEILLQLEFYSNCGLTILIPAFTFSFGAKKRFDVRQDKPEVSAFAKFLFSRGQKRTVHPIYSFFIIGNDKDFLDNINTNCVGQNSPFRFLNSSRASILSVGHHPISTYSSIHDIEYILGVKYREAIQLEGTLCNSIGLESNVSSLFFARIPSICEFSSVTVSCVEKLTHSGIITCSLIKHGRSFLAYTLNMHRSAKYILRNHTIDSPLVGSFHSKSSNANNIFLDSDCKIAYKEDFISLVR